VSVLFSLYPPPKDAVIQKPKKNKPVPDFPIRRNEAVPQIQEQGSEAWKEQQGYHQRSLDEVVMFRYKTLFSGELNARTIDNQRTEVKLKCLLLTRFQEIGMPVSYKVQKAVWFITLLWLLGRAVLWTRCNNVVSKTK
jgi:hypothetical protein